MGRTDFVSIFESLNKVTKLDSFPMPLVADALDSLAGTSLFSCLDSKKWFLANSNAFWLKGKNSFRHS